MSLKYLHRRGALSMVLVLATGGLLAGCAPVRLGSFTDLSQPPWPSDGKGEGPRPTVVRKSKGVIAKGETSGRVGNDTYVCMDKACKEAIKVE